MHTAIDTHAHVYPAHYLDMLEEAGVDPATTKIARNLNADSTDEDITRRLSWMDKAGVQTQVIAVSPQIPSGTDAGLSAKAARWINEEYVRLVHDYPGRFLAYGALPLPFVEESLTELEWIAAREEFVGVSITAVLPGGMSITDPSLAPVWEALNERKMIVNIHPTGSGAHSPMINDFHLEWVNGAPMEDAIAVLQLLKRDYPHLYPNIRFHVAHLGGDLPFLAQRIEDNFSDWGSFPRSPAQTVRTMWFDAANFHEPSLRIAAEYYGATQILGGSDHPYFQDEKYVRAFDYIRTSKLDDADRERILALNAADLYGIPAPDAVQE
ncbi:amidohydrolase family protein [Arcanobacterium canis]